VYAGASGEPGSHFKLGAFTRCVQFLFAGTLRSKPAPSVEPLPGIRLSCHATSNTAIKYIFALVWVVHQECGCL
jgi:hypothetical protein